MTLRILVRSLAIVMLVSAAGAASAQETIRLRIASGHPPVNTYVNLMQTFFVPEVTKRVAEKTKQQDRVCRRLWRRDGESGRYA